MRLHAASLLLPFICLMPATSSDGPAVINRLGSDTLTSIIAVLDSVASLTRPAAAIWPGFDLREHVLIVTSPRFTVVMGDSSPPSDYKPVTRGASPPIFVRDGTPPDSLAGLQLFKKWNGKPMTGLPYSSRPIFPEVIVHEAFHTHQINDRWSWSNSGTPVFPDTSISAVALIHLEAEQLVKALSTNRETARNEIIEALAIRKARCGQLGTDECDAEEKVEQSEGVATFVGLRTVGMTPEQFVDSLQTALMNYSAPGRLMRFHYYATGLSWVLLLDLYGPQDWKARIRTQTPTAIFREHYRVVPSQSDALFAAVQSSARMKAAKAAAEAFVAGKRR